MLDIIDRLILIVFGFTLLYHTIIEYIPNNYIILISVLLVCFAFRRRDE